MEVNGVSYHGRQASLWTVFFEVCSAIMFIFFLKVVLSTANKNSIDLHYNEDKAEISKVDILKGCY